MVGGVVTTEAGSSPGRAGGFRQGLLPGSSLPIQDRARGTQEGQPSGQLPPLLTPSPSSLWLGPSLIKDFLGLHISCQGQLSQALRNFWTGTSGLRAEGRACMVLCHF